MSKLLKYLQEKVVFLPVKLPEAHQFDFGTDFDEYLLDSPFGGKINILHFKITQPKGVILYFHGNADNLHRWGKIAHEYTRFEYDIMVMDYRGYGKSTGPRSENFLYSDAQFFYDFAKEKYNEGQVVVYGRSLGGTFALQVAANNRPRAVILEATFYNLQDVVNRWLPKKITDRVSPVMTYHFRSDQNIVKVQVPLYQFHGTQDKIIPLQSGKKLYDLFEKAQPNVEKKFMTIEGAGHNNLITFEKFVQEITKILS